MKNKLKGSLFFLLILLFFNCSPQYLKRIPVEYHSMVKEALQKAGENRNELITFLHKCNDEEIVGAAFLLSYMPERDLTTLKVEFLYESIKYAYLARKQTNWGKSIPDSLFLNYVLPYANIHERRDNWRKDFYNKFVALVKHTSSPGEAAIILNHSIWDTINVHYSTDRPKADQSPYESIEVGRATCTGLAIIFVDACRSVGIPARFTGVPMWHTNNGNHSWSEIWDNGWHFVESITSDSLDRAWFQELATHANHSERKYGIYALSYKKTDSIYHDIFDSTANYLWAIDVTDRYSKESSKDEQHSQANLKVIVKEKNNGKRIYTKVQLVQENKVLSEGFSRGESKDLNDVLTFKVKPKVKYEIIVTNNKKTIRKEIRTNNKLVQILIITLPLENP